MFAVTDFVPVVRLASYLGICGQRMQCWSHSCDVFIGGLGNGQELFLVGFEARVKTRGGEHKVHRIMCGAERLGEMGLGASGFYQKFSGCVSFP